MIVLIGCEESQEVCKAFRALEHEAYSCDLKPCSGGHPEWHIQCDVLEILGEQIRIVTQDGIEHWIERWDLGIFHPTCTRLCNSGVMWLSERNLWEEMRQGALFFKQCLEANIPLVAVENPIPHKYALEIIGRKYDQVIQPWMFEHGETKATCLWLKGLPKLEPTNIVIGRIQRLHRLPPSKDRAMLRSKTYPGIAKAMAQQWGVLLPLNVNKKEDGFPPNNKLLGIQPKIL